MRLWVPGSSEVQHARVMWLWLCGFESRLHLISCLSVIHFAVTIRWIMFPRWGGTATKWATSEVCFDCGTEADEAGFSSTILSHRGSLMHFNKLWSESDGSHWKLDPCCWEISSAVEKKLKYLTHRCYCNRIQISRRLLNKWWRSGYLKMLTVVQYRVAYCTSHLNSLWHIKNKKNTTQWELRFWSWKVLWLMGVVNR